MGWYSYDPNRKNLDWLKKEMTEVEINEHYDVIKEKVWGERNADTHT